MPELCSWTFFDSNAFQSFIILVTAIMGFFIWRHQKHFDIVKDVVIAAKNYEQSICKLRIYFTRARDQLSTKKDVPKNEYKNEYLKFYINEALKNIEHHSDAIVRALNHAGLILDIDFDAIKQEVLHLNIEIRASIVKIGMYNFDIRRFQVQSATPSTWVLASSKKAS